MFTIINPGSNMNVSGDGTPAKNTDSENHTKNPIEIPVFGDVKNLSIPDFFVLVFSTVAVPDSFLAA